VDKNKMVEFQDADTQVSTYGKDGLTFKAIVLHQLQKIVNLQSREMRGGFWQTKTIPVGNGMVKAEKFYVADAREEYGGAVDALHDLLIPYFDVKLKELDKILKSQLKILKEDVIDASSIDETEVLDNEFYTDPKNKLIIANYRFKKLNISRRMFQGLCCFLHRKKYLELGSIED